MIVLGGLSGYNTDHPLATGEFSKCGVTVLSLPNMEIPFANLPAE